MDHCEKNCYQNAFVDDKLNIKNSLCTKCKDDFLNCNNIIILEDVYNCGCNQNPHNYKKINLSK
jgi:hypothetical protein